MDLFQRLEERRQLCNRQVKRVFEDAAFEVMDEALDLTARSQLIERAANEAKKLRDDYISWSEQELSKEARLRQGLKDGGDDAGKV